MPMQSGPRFTPGNYYEVHTKQGEDVRVIFTGKDEAPFVTDDGGVLGYENIDQSRAAKDFGPRTSGSQNME